MKKEDIYLSDWQRILFGDVPAEFTLEVIVRTIIIYLAFLVVMRLLGKRMNAQLTITELAVMLTLGAIISVPMQIPNRGLLPAALLLLSILCLQRGINWFALKRRKAETVLQGKVSLLAKNGVLEPACLREERISHEQVFAALRNHKITHLGQVKRLYIEADGSFSVYKQEPATPGLSVLPGQDTRFKQEQPLASGQQVCTYCGNLAAPKTTPADSASTVATKPGQTPWPEPLA